ncbi:MAG: hypothetical protein JKX69_11305 [Rhodobacteraceae bacterium]|nr:hypothetical protein [Paracoccaceae bacterium]
MEEFEQLYGQRTASAAQPQQRRCILHLGMHKTGTTMLQNTFSNYRDKNFRYLNLGHPNHSKLVGVGFQKVPYASHYSNPDQATWPAQKKKARATFMSALNAADRSIIISGEEIARLSKKADCEALVDAIGTRFDRIEMLTYIRDPAGFMRSSFQQIMKARQVELDYAALFPKYFKHFRNWELALERQPSPTFVLYDRNNFMHQDLARDFGWRIGLDDKRVKRLKKFAGLNASLSAESLAVLYVYRQARGSVAPHERQMNSLLIRVMKDFGKNSYQLDPERIDALMKENSDEVNWIESKINARFAPQKPADITFTDGNSLYDYARQVGPELAAYIRSLRFEPVNDGSDIPELLDGLIKSLSFTAAVRSKLAPVKKLARPLINLWRAK